MPVTYKVDGPCPFGCIFHNGKLYGDCRAPYRDECYLNKKERRYEPRPHTEQDTADGPRGRGGV